jgi:hypothetical protein
MTSAEDHRFRREVKDELTEAGRLYNTTQGLVALRALGEKPEHDPRPALAAILNEDLKTLAPYSTSFFPRAYLAAGSPYAPEADRKVRALMVQAPDGYLNEHIAATFHAVHYHRLLGEATPKAAGILERTLRDQRPDGSWILNPPSRDRHATFDAAFVIKQLAAAGRSAAARSNAPRNGPSPAGTPTAASATSRAAPPMPTRSTSRSARW